MGNAQIIWIGLRGTPFGDWVRWCTLRVWDTSQWDHSLSYSCSLTWSSFYSSLAMTPLTIDSLSSPESYFAFRADAACACRSVYACAWARRLATCHWNALSLAAPHRSTSPVWPKSRSMPWAPINVFVVASAICIAELPISAALVTANGPCFRGNSWCIHWKRICPRFHSFLVLAHMAQYVFSACACWLCSRSDTQSLSCSPWAATTTCPPRSRPPSLPRSQHTLHSKRHFSPSAAIRSDSAGALLGHTRALCGRCVQTTSSYYPSVKQLKAPPRRTKAWRGREPRSPGWRHTPCAPRGAGCNYDCL